MEEVCLQFSAISKMVILSCFSYVYTHIYCVGFHRKSNDLFTVASYCAVRSSLKTAQKDSKCLGWPNLLLNDPHYARHQKIAENG